MENNEAWVVLRADIDDIKRKLDSLKVVGGQAAQQMQSTWTSNLAKIGSAIGIVFSTRQIIDFVKNSVSAFAETEASATTLNNVLKNLGIPQERIQTVEAFVDNLEKATAFDDSQIREALTNAITKLGNVDLAINTVLTATELARARSLSLADAVQRLSLGLMGNSRGLRDVGINIKDFTDGEINAKVQTEILDAVFKKVQGSVAGYANTTKGSIDKMKTSFTNLQEAIGRELAPAVNDSANLITSAFDRITNALNEMNKREQEAKKAMEDFRVEVDQITGLPISVTPIYTAGEAFDRMMKKNVYGNLRNVQKATEDLGNTAENVEKAFEPLWKPITIQGGNFPELVKFVGNLRYVAPTIKKKVEISVNVNVKDTSSGQVAKTIASQVKQEIKYESHGGIGWLDVGSGLGG